ncbi:MAG: hypothetical protein FWH53_00345 [Leptospirales bacterium]|nr:hypothetical protein [Leptospirales bacterium]
MNKDLNERLQNAMKKNKTQTFDSTTFTDDVSTESGIDNSADNSTQKNDVNNSTGKNVKRIHNNLFIIFGGICAAIFIAGFLLSSSSSVDTSNAAKKALVDRVSTSLSVGTILLSGDESAASRNYTIAHNHSQKDTKIWIWDYAAEDGDYVQVFVNGTPLGDAFMIKHKPVEITVPAIAKIQVKGVRDGGGGITYAAHYELNKTTYFNNAPEGGFNTYTLIRK